MEFVTNAELQAYGQGIADELAAALAQWDDSRERSKQSEARILGMSSLGGCREYLRATIAGDPKGKPTKLKLPAIMGTAGGDVIEEAARKFLGATTQATITVTLPNGMKVTGHTDIIRSRKAIVDLKSKDGIREVAADGPSFENLVQIAGYQIGGIQQGLLDEDAVGVLVYYDRAGNDKTFYAHTITLEQAEGYLQAAVERLDDVAKALTTGVTPARHLQDKPESWCFHTQCEFYNQCWDGYLPLDQRLDPGQEEAVNRYERGRDLDKLSKEMQRTAKAELYPDYDHRVEGVGRTVDPDGQVPVIKWVARTGKDGQVFDSIDVRRIPAPKRELPF